MNSKVRFAWWLVVDSGAGTSILDGNSHHGFKFLQTLLLTSLSLCEGAFLSPLEKSILIDNLPVTMFAINT